MFWNGNKFTTICTFSSEVIIGGPTNCAKKHRLIKVILDFFRLSLLYKYNLYPKKCMHMQSTGGGSGVIPPGNFAILISFSGISCIFLVFYKVFILANACPPFFGAAKWSKTAGLMCAFHLTELTGHTGYLGGLTLQRLQINTIRR